jgi:hypothetical protein
MKRSFWFVGSCGAVLFSGWWVFAMIYTRKAPLSAVMMLVLGLFAAWEGFKMFHSGRNSK